MRRQRQGVAAGRDRWAYQRIAGRSALRLGGSGGSDNERAVEPAGLCGLLDIGHEYIAPHPTLALVNEHVRPAALADLEPRRVDLEAARRGTSLTRDEQAITRCNRDQLVSLVIPLGRVSRSAGRGDARTSRHRLSSVPGAPRRLAYLSEARRSRASSRSGSDLATRANSSLARGMSPALS